MENIRPAIKEYKMKREEHIESENKKERLKDAIINKEIRRECSELYKLFINTIQNEVPKDIKECDYKNNNNYNICNYGHIYILNNKIKFPYMLKKYGNLSRKCNNSTMTCSDNLSSNILKLDDYCYEFNELNIKLIQFKTGLNISYPTVFVASEEIKDENVDYNKLNFNYNFSFCVSLK